MTLADLLLGLCPTRDFNDHVEDLGGLEVMREMLRQEDTTTPFFFKVDTVPTSRYSTLPR